MGVHKEKRTILTPGIKGTSASTFAGNVRLAADFTVPTETVNSTGGAAPTLSDHGVSIVVYGTSGQSGDVILPAPPRAGAIKHIVAVNNTTSVELNINTLTTAGVFYGTTNNTITISAASTGSPGGVPGGTAYLGLIGITTASWAVYAGTTFNWDYSATTGSTDA